MTKRLLQRPSRRGKRHRSWCSIGGCITAAKVGSNSIQQQSKVLVFLLLAVVLGFTFQFRNWNDLAAVGFTEFALTSQEFGAIGKAILPDAAFEIMHLRNNNREEVLQQQHPTTTDSSNGTVVNLTTDITDRFTSSSDNHCDMLKEKYGFWNAQQCDLWKNYIATNATVDMSPYLASNIPENQRWWQQPPRRGKVVFNDTLSPGTPPIVMDGREQRGRLIYHLHIHKMGGTFFCNNVFQKAHPRYGLLRNNAFGTINVVDNCNVPTAYWRDLFRLKVESNSSTYALGYPGGMEQMKLLLSQFQAKDWYQYAPYFGDTRDSMKVIYRRIVQGNRSGNWIFVANEGSMELEPIFVSQGPYFYSTILREPMSWIHSMFRYDQIIHRTTFSLLRYLEQGIWGGPHFVTRRLCGCACVMLNNSEFEAHPEQYFLRAKSMLEHFDLILTLEDMNKELKDGLLGKTFPSLEFQHEKWKQQTATTSSPNAKQTTGNNTSEGIPHNTSAASSVKRRLRQQSNNGNNASTTNHPHKDRHGAKKPPKLSQRELDLIREYTWMDKVLYEYAKILIQQRRRKT